MSGLIAMASSKEIIMPSEIQEYNDAGIFDIPNKAFSLSTIGAWEERKRIKASL